MPALIGIRLRVPATREGLLRILAYLVSANRAYLRRHPRTPSIYDSGVHYRREPGHEQWKTIPEIISDGYGDCEDLACWLIAELRQKGIKAKPHLTKKRALWHVRVRMPSGIIVDPSKTLGM